MAFNSFVRTQAGNRGILDSSWNVRNMEENDLALVAQWMYCLAVKRNIPEWEIALELREEIQDKGEQGISEYLIGSLGKMPVCYITGCQIAELGKAPGIRVNIKDCLLRVIMKTEFDLNRSYLMAAWHLAVKHFLFLPGTGRILVEVERRSPDLIGVFGKLGFKMILRRDHLTFNLDQYVCSRAAFRPIANL